VRAWSARWATAWVDGHVLPYHRDPRSRHTDRTADSATSAGRFLRRPARGRANRWVTGLFGIVQVGHHPAMSGDGLPWPTDSRVTEADRTTMLTHACTSPASGQFSIASIASKTSRRRAANALMWSA
jgi:hypothetical protein